MDLFSRSTALCALIGALGIAACDNSAVCDGCQLDDGSDDVDTGDSLPPGDGGPGDTDLGRALRFTVADLSLETGECRAVSVETAGADGALLPSSVTVALDVPAPLAAFSDAGCTTAATTVQTSSGSGTFYVSTTQASSYQLGVSAPGFAAGTISVTVTNGPPVALGFVIPADVPAFECTTYSVRLFNAHGRPTTTTSNLTVAFAALPPPPSSAGCNSLASGGTLTILAGESQATNRGAFETPTTLTVSTGTLPEVSTLVTPLWRTVDASPDIATLPRFRTVTIGADGSLWVLMASGQAMRSVDGGSTWEARCRFSGTRISLAAADIPIVVSAADGRAYAYEHALRAHSGECLYNTDMYALSTPAIAGDGDVYQMGQRYADPTSYALMVSRDGMASWELVSTPTTGFVSSLAVSPTDETHLLFAGSGGIFRSVNGGVDFEPVHPTGARLVYDPAHPGYVYADSLISSNDGLSWTSSSAHDTQSPFPISIDASGAGYRLGGDTTTTRIERAPDMRTPVWTTLPGGTFATRFASSETALSVSTDGQTIAAVIRGRLQLSTNGGTSFTAVPVPVNELWSVGLQVASFDGVGLTAASTDWMILTRDGSASWTSPATLDRQPDNVWLAAVSDATFYVRSRGIGGSVQVAGTQNRFDDVALASMPSSSGVALATRPGDPLRVAIVDPAFTPRLHTSTDGAATAFVTTGPAYPTAIAVSPFAVINPVDPNIIWYNDLANGATHLRALDVAAGTVSEITVTADFAPAAMEVYADGNGGYVERLVSSSGALVTSTDELQTFSEVTPGPNGGSCRTGVLASSPLDRDTLAFFGVSADAAELFLTRDAGVTWRTLRGPRRCAPTQIAFTATDVIMSCAYEQPVLYSLDP